MYMIIAVVIVVKIMQYPKIQEIQNTKMNGKHFSIVCTTLLVGFLFRVILSAINPAHEYDMNCFTYWSDAVYKNGFAKFYNSDFFADYPPGYMYILWIIGKLRSSFPALQDSIFLIKLPSVILDLAVSVLIYIIAKKKYSHSQSTLWMALYLFHPVILIDSSIWGQCDSVLAFFGLLFCYFITEKKLIPSYFVFAVGILMKPQMLMFAPLLLCGIYQQILKKFDKKNFFKHLGAGLLSIIFMIIAVVPYNLILVWKQYQATLSSYPYASYNGYNFWTFLHLNFKPQTDKFLSFQLGNQTVSITYEMVGTLATALLVIFVLSLCIRNVNKKNDLRLDSYYFYSALIVCVFFTMSVRMHERYMYSALVFLLVTYMIYPIKGLLFAFLLATFVQVNNIWYVFRFYDINTYDWDDPYPRIIGAFCVFLCIFMVYLAIRYYWNESKIVVKDGFGYDNKFNWICGIMLFLYLMISIILGDLTNSKKGEPIEYTTVSDNTVSWGCDADTVSDALKQDADSTETKDDCTEYVYEKCVLGDYTGKMTYYFAADQLTLSRWEYSTKDVEGAQKAYDTLKKQLETENGEGTENDASDICQWQGKDKNITLGYEATNDGGQVYLIEYQ